ncbi:MAG: benzoyl-CoA-dihydrodiol lyase [Deltaproteobacteria bacterium]|nr:benzoyl-CoA-dihydrodiol lyase [Deltaproteobacteria bacterium]
MADAAHPPVSFETHPSKYKHWKLDISGPIAAVTMKVDEDAPMWPGAYELKLNSYDLSVDIELYDLSQRLRFEHPEVRAVVLTGGYDRIFCAGANIRMLAQASHAFKVNFCKFTNETRCGIEADSRSGNATWIAALNGTASGGGYELAMACEEIYLIDDGNSAVSLPEVPLLGVLPGTGGLTRLTDKRKVRRDMADVFCTKAEGFKARDAVKYHFVDGSFPRSKWAASIEARAQAAVANNPMPTDAAPIVLEPLEPVLTDTHIEYDHVNVRLDRAARIAHVTVQAPGETPSTTSRTWALRCFRELDDALLRLRVNNLDIGLLVFKCTGDREAVIAHDAALDADTWFNRQVRAYQARVLQRLDNMAKSIFALVEPGSAFAGSLFEIALAADRSYMLHDDDETNKVVVTGVSHGRFPMHSGITRLEARYPGEPPTPAKILALGEALDAPTCEELGLVTMTPDEIDWDDEIRIAIEERASLSPDALTGMEQNLRFGGTESMDNKIYGRLTAWQNWIFQRPNAVGERGALKMFGAPERAVYDYRRT